MRRDFVIRHIPERNPDASSLFLPDSLPLLSIGNPDGKKKRGRPFYARQGPLRYRDNRQRSHTISLTNPTKVTTNFKYVGICEKEEKKKEKKTKHINDDERKIQETVSLDGEPRGCECVMCTYFVRLVPSSLFYNYHTLRRYSNNGTRTRVNLRMNTLNDDNTIRDANCFE